MDGPTVPLRRISPDGDGDGDADAPVSIEEQLPVKRLLGSILHFGLLSSGNTIRSELAHRYWRKINEILKLLKPVIEDVPGSFPNNMLNNEVDELDASVNEARELIEGWHHMTSKMFYVLEIESVITRIRISVLETCKVLGSLFPTATDKSLSRCLQQMDQMHYDQTSGIIKEAIKDQIGKKVPGPEHLEKISYSLSLGSSQELLMEAVALDKLKAIISHCESRTEIEHIDHLIALVAHMHDCLVRIKQLHSINGVPIPTDFCCPLSLELMTDPVIVASGQTYERAFIKKWLDHGFTICPKTRQTLGHINLITNYTVKALIANWCESNDIKLPDPSRSLNISEPTPFLNHADDSVMLTGALSSSNNYLRPPELSGKGIPHVISANGIHPEVRQLVKSASPDQLPVSLCPPLSNAGAFEANISRLSLTSEDNVDSCSEDGHMESISHSGQPRSNSQGLVIDEHAKRNIRGLSTSCDVSSNGYIEDSGDANILSHGSSDLTHYTSDCSGEVTAEIPAAPASQRENEFPRRPIEGHLRSQNIWLRNPDRFSSQIVPSRPAEPRPDLSGVETHVHRLIEDLNSDSIDVQRAATEELRILARHNVENRIVIANCGAITLLVALLHSTDPKAQENAVTALLNLSINDNNKTAIANAEAIDPLIHVLQTGNPEARENAAATLFSLSVIEENKIKIGRSGAIRPLVELLGNGTPRGKKDAATALYNLSIFHENKSRIVQAGAVRCLVELMDPAAGMVDKAVAVLANLATIPEGRNAIGHAHGIPVLVEVVELGSARGKENASAALLQLCTNSNRFCSQVLQEGAVPPLVALSQSGTPRAKEKAQALLSYFRNQRHGNAGRVL